MEIPKKVFASSINSVRPYKSRSKRPCDFCRRRKTCCIIQNHIPCMACAQFNKGACTFVEGPFKRENRKPTQPKAKRMAKKPDFDNGESPSSEAWVPPGYYGSNNVMGTQASIEAVPTPTDIECPAGNTTGNMAYSAQVMPNWFSACPIPSYLNASTLSTLLSETNSELGRSDFLDVVNNPLGYNTMEYRQNLEDSRQLTLLLVSTLSSFHNQSYWLELPRYEAS